MVGKRPAMAVGIVAVMALAALLIVKDRGIAHPERETGTVGVAAVTPDMTASQITTMPAKDALDPLSGLSVTQQRLLRGGMGSKAMTSFTLVNKNDSP